MAVDISRQGAKGGDPSYDTGQLRGVREERGIITAIVKANVHPTHMGVIKVWNSTFSTDESDKTQWRTVRYCTPFYSRVDNAGSGDSYFNTKVTAGIVTPPPDLGTKVLCFFPEGRNSEGYYFACVPDLYMMQTLPEAGISEGTIAGEFNDSPSGAHNTGKIVNWRSQQRPEDFFTQDTLTRQGLSDDRIRGLNNSNYMRESPAEIIGISSKGRRITTSGQDFTQTYNSELKNPETADKKILAGLLGPTARRKGHSITLDDGDIDGNSNQIRLRTSTGHQILMNDTEGVVYVGNADGSVWIELSNEGTVDVYAQNSINFRSNNINFHADENIKFHSKGFTQFVADKQMHVQGKQQLVMNSDGEAGITGEKGLHLNSGSELFASAGSSAYINSGANMSINGALILLQGPSTKAKQAQAVNPLQKEDTTYFPDLDQFILDEEQMVTTSVDRVVTHEPFPYHGVANTASAYTGGLVGGGGGMGGAFSVVGGVGSFGGLGLSPGALGGALANTGGLSAVASAVTSGGVGTVLSGGAGALVSGGAGSLLGNGLQSNVLSSLSTGGFDVGNIGSQLGGLSGITSSLPLGDIQNSLGGVTSQLGGADFGKLIADSTGKITSIGSIAENVPGLADVTGQLSSVTNVIPDNLSSVIDIPAVTKFPVTDMVKQVNTGFSVGALDSFDVQGLQAAVVKQVGSGNNPAFVDSVTKSVGKFGFNVDQLKAQGFVRPEAIFNDQLADSSVWTGKGGASSLNKLLGNSGLQEQIQQGIVAADYQKLVDLGGIKSTDGKKEITSMLTAANISSADIASKVRQGEQAIEGVLRNTTNIPAGDDVASKVKQSMQVGASASQRVEQIKSQADANTQAFLNTALPDANVQRDLAIAAGKSTRRQEEIANSRGGAQYEALRNQAKQLRKQLWEGKDTLSKQDKDRIRKQMNVLLAQADSALGAS